MILTTRLLLFYLGSVAILLAGFSTSLFLIAKDHLHRQTVERLDAALNTLGAAIEMTADGVEWEPNDRALRISTGPEQIAWVVTDGSGHVVAGSEQPDLDDLVREAAGRFQGQVDVTRKLHWRGERWQGGQRSFVTDGTGALAADQPGSRAVTYPTLIVTVALPLEPIRSMLHELLLVLAAVSFGILLLGLAAGRFVCRRALRPVRQMADDARAVDPTDASRRIVTPGGGDELTDLGAAFNGLLDRLHESAERHRRFAGDASHQLRTPLSALMGQLEIALRRERTMDEYREVLATAQGKAAHLHRIVEALLFLTRAGSEGLPKREPFDLAAWLSAQLAPWAGHPRYSDIRLVGVDGSLMVESSPILLGEVLSVLLDNACRYSLPGTPITVSLGHSDGTARLEVADQGQGIEASDLPQVFTPFFRTTSALRANKQGVGLGLSLARRLAEALGGELNVMSQVGEGSYFVLTLPTAPAAPAI